MNLSIIFKNSRRHVVTTNENVFHLAGLGRSLGYITCNTGVFFFDVGHIRILHVWREAVTAGKNNLAHHTGFSAFLPYSILLLG
jgi:hypothetical protein